MFSIITVCFNARSLLPATFASLRAQDCTDYEWVVMDGASTDGSVEWLKTQRPDVFVSEADGGIYDAMNRAVRHASGDWLYFLNAGDALADGRVLSDVACCIRAEPKSDLIYGDVLYVGSQGDRAQRFDWLTRRRLVFGDLCHQATFARSTLFERHGAFDDSLRFNADFDWFIRVFRHGAGLRYLPRMLARFDDSGAHVQAAKAHEVERDVVRARYCPRPMWLVGHGLLRLELKARQLIARFTGSVGA